MQNLLPADGQPEFLSRHYGILMRVHCKRRVTTSLQPLLQKDEKLFQLPQRAGHCIAGA